MKLITFETADGLGLGVVTEDGVLPLDGSDGGDAIPPRPLLAEGEPGLARIRAALERTTGSTALRQERGCEQRTGNERAFHTVNCGTPASDT